jgi:sugar phosphate permease
MKGKVNSGLVAGILNGFCYVGSTISDYGLGAVQEATGSWSSVFYVLMFACLAVVLVAGIFTLNGVLDKLLHKKLGGNKVKE